MIYWVIRVSANANEPQLVMSNTTVNILPGPLKVCTSVKPAVVTVMVVMYTASTKEKCSMAIYPTMPAVMIQCSIINGCNSRQNEWFTGSNGFSKYTASPAGSNEIVQLQGEH